MLQAVRSDALYLPWGIFNTRGTKQVKEDNTFYNKDGDAVPAYAETKDHLVLPRAYQLPDEIPTVDETTTTKRLKRLAFAKSVMLYPFQAWAIYDTLAKLLTNDSHGGLLVCRTGGGKTVMSLKIVSLLKQKTLVLVDQLDLMAQWYLRIKTYLPGAKVAMYNGAKKDKSGWEDADIVIATFQTVTRGVPGAFRDAFGLLMVDEVHVASAPTFLNCVTMIRAKYRLGLTATPYRGDKLQGVFFAHIGPVLHEVPKEEVDKIGVTIDPDVYVRDTPFDCEIPMMRKWDASTRRWVPVVNDGRLMTMCCTSEEHNEPIQNEIARAVNAGRKILIISDRNDQLKLLLKWCHQSEISASIIIGSIKNLDKRVAAFQSQVVLANYKIVQKGLDCPPLDVLMYASLRKDRTSLEQANGRVSRNFPGKKKPIVIIFRPKVGPIRYKVRSMLEVMEDAGCTIKTGRKTA